MRAILAVVGRMKSGPERDLCLRYLERAAAAGRAVGLSDALIKETPEGRAGRPQDRRAAEAESLRALIPGHARLIALDETGSALTSADFAHDLQRARDEGASAYVLAIGGPDGLDPAFRASAHLVLAFGAMTWPHQLVRVMAAEQLYRAATILAGHPYHRA